MDDVILVKNILRRIESLENTDDEEGEIENSASLADSIKSPSISETLGFKTHKYLLICGQFICGGDKII
jgi:hypothetical protein